MLSIGRDARRRGGGYPSLEVVENSGEFTHSLNSPPHPQGSADLKERTEGAEDKTWTGLHSKAATTSNVPHGMNNEGMSYAPAGAAAILSEKRRATETACGIIGRFCGIIQANLHISCKNAR